MGQSKTIIILGALFIGPSFVSGAATPSTPPKADAATSDDDKAAMKQAAADADKWAASVKTDEETTGQRDSEKSKDSNVSTSRSPEVSESAGSPPSPSVPNSPSTSTNPAALPGVSATNAATPLAAETAKPAAKSVPRVTGLNEMQGKLLSISDDPKTFRLIVDGGFNVEFTYDQKTSVINGGHDLDIDELGYNDVIIVRYAGRDLNAVQVERVSKAPRPE